MQNTDQQIKKLLTQLNLTIENYDGKSTITKEEQKKLKKRLKKFYVDQSDSSQAAVDKTKKLLDDIYKNYELTAKQLNKNQGLKLAVQSSKNERDSSLGQLKMIEGLQKQFKTKYETILKQAQQIEKKEDDKRKSLIEELQTRIKTVQQQYENAGKIKIQRYRENETLKHELSSIQPKAVTTQSLMQAQLKKKQIQIQIQMTTLRQKIEMMSNFKKMGEQTKQKLQTAETANKKIEQRLSVLDSKQNQNKIVVTRAHLILEEYKKSITKINDLLSKHEKQALKAQQTLRKKQESTEDIDKSIANIENECETQKGQIQILLNMEASLKKELGI